MKSEAIYRELLKTYRPDEFPALGEQIRDWGASRPLAGRMVFDATPVFRNTMMKHVALLEAGAELTVGFGRGIPYDPAVVGRLRETIRCRESSTTSSSTAPGRMPVCGRSTAMSS